MAVAHVGDSRIYLLHHGTLVRVTHDHSYVEELVDSGQITADEARNHPSRSVVTRALGSDPEMYADHFTLEVSDGDRIILCSDGLSSMILDDEIESIAVSNITPQNAADSLVSAAIFSMTALSRRIAAALLAVFSQPPYPSLLFLSSPWLSPCFLSEANTT